MVTEQEVRLAKWAGSGNSVTLTDSVITESGSNIGIGTSSPNQLLEISKSGSPVIRLNSSKTTNGSIGDSIGRIEWRGSNLAGNGAGIKATIDTSATSTTQRDFDILFKTSNNVGSGEPTTRMQINADGQVQFNAYGTGTLVADASGNITSISGGGEGGPYLPLAGGTLTGNITAVKGIFEINNQISIIDSDDSQDFS